MLAGLGYARAMLFGLTTIWRNAVGSTGLEFHVTAISILIGLVSSTVLAVGRAARHLSVTRPDTHGLCGRIDQLAPGHRAACHLI